MRNDSAVAAGKIKYVLLDFTPLAFSHFRLLIASCQFNSEWLSLCRNYLKL